MPPRLPAILEELEHRLLLSADAQPLLLDPSLLEPEAEAPPLLELDPGSRDAAALARTELVFVDAAAPDAERLVEQLRDASEDGRDLRVFLLDAERDGLMQIGEVLELYEGVDAVHVISHGTAGAVQLGSTWLHGGNLEAFADTLRGWSGSLSAEADLLFYGCDLAAGAEGQALVARLAELTGADVAASIDATGAALLGGDWELEHRTGSVETTLALDAQAQLAFQKILDGTAIWTEQTNSTPQTSDFDGISFGTESTTADVNGQWRVLAGAEAPTRDEKIVVGVYENGATDQLSGMLYDAGSWSAFSFNDFASVGDSFWWSFAVGYESQSGDAMLVYNNGGTGTTGLSYRTYDGATWSGATNITTPLAGEPEHMRLATSPDSDEMLLVVSNDSSQDYALVWDGDSWGDAQILDSAGGDDRTDVYVAYEQQSGDALVTFAKGGTDVSYRTWNGTAWSGEGTLSAPGGVTDYARWTTLGSDASSDRIALGVRSNANETWLSVWDGSSWGSTLLASTDETATPNFHGVAVAFESTSGEALAVYGDDTNKVQYRTWSSGGGWSAEVDGPDLGAKIRTLTLDAEPVSDQIMLMGSDLTEDVHAVFWDGQSFGGKFDLEGDTDEVKNQPFLFLWDRDAAAEASAETAFWLSTGGDVTDGASGIVAWTEGEALSFGDPGLELEPVSGSTGGSFGHAFDLDAFGGDTDVDAIHYVTRNITVGSANAIDLFEGDLLLSTQASESLTSLNSLSVENKDVFVFRPVAPGDYSSGTFIMLLDDPTSGAAIRGVSLVEKDTTVGDTTLSAGDFLIVTSGGSEDEDVRLFQTTDVGSGTTSGTVVTLLDGTDTNVGIAQQLHGIDLLENAATIGGHLLSAGTILLTTNAADTVGSNNVGVDQFDVFALDITATTLVAGAGNGAATATLVLEGADVGLASGGEELDAITTLAAEPPDATFQEGVAAYAGTEDTEIRSDTPDTSYGANASITVDDDDAGAQVQGLLQFQSLFGTGAGQIPPGVTIDSVQLVIQVTDPGAAGATIGLHRMLESWSEASTWNSLSTSGSGVQTDDTEAASLADVTVGDPEATGTITLSGAGLVATVQAWADGADNNGWVIVNDNGEGWDFRTSEDGTPGLRPKLVVNYTNSAPVLIPATPSLTGISEDDVANAGQTVASIVGTSITDADSGAFEGIAITALSSGNGTWQYDTGSGFTDIGSVASNNALLLRATDKVRFVPDGLNADSASFDFRAWDQTSGTAGAKVDPGAGGDATAFSTASDTASITVSAVNDAPVIGGTAAGQPVNDNATVSPFSAVTISDVDTGEMVTVTVTLSDGDDNGAFTAASLTASGFTKTGVGEYTLAAGTPGAAQTAIRQLVFDPTENQVAPAGTVTTTFTIEVDDGDTAPTDNTTTAVATSINDAPVIGGTAAGQPVNDNATVSPFSAVTISDVDFGESVTVVVTLSDGDDNGAFTAASLTASGFTKTGVGEYSLAAGTPAAAQTAIRQLVFDPTENQVAPGGTVTTTFTIEVDDGDTAPTDNSTTVVATSINDAPVIGGTAAGQPVNDNATVSPFSAVTISDVDFGEMVTVVVTLSDGDDNGAFTAASLTASGFTKTGVGEYSLAAGTPGAAQTAIRQLVFDPTENQVAPAGTVTTTFTIEVDDGDTAPTDSTTTVVATSINDAPVIGGTAAGQPVNDNATVSPFSAVTISDVDFGESVTVVVTLSDGDDNGAFTAASLTASGFTKTGVGEYSLAAGTPGAAQTAIRQLVFDPTENQVAPGGTVTTTFTIEVDDGDTAPTDSTTTVVATSINDAPVIGGTAAGQPVNDNATVSPFSAVTISDVDFGESVTVVVTLSDNDDNGAFTAASLTASGFTKTGVGEYSLAAGTPGAAQTAIRQLVFDPTENQVAPGGTVTTTFTIEVDDGDATPTDNTTTVVATSINDAPQIGGTAAGQPVDDNATVSPFSAVTISDVDFGESVTVVVTLSDGDDNGAFTAASLTASGFTKTGVGEYSLAAGTPAAAQTAIRQLVFDPTENQVAPGGTVNTTFTIEVDDGDATPTDNTTTVVATSINDAPQIGGTAAGQPVDDNATVSPFSAVTISDVDFGESVTVVVTLSDGDDNGAFTAASLTASGFTKTGVGEYSLAAGTPAAAQTAIRQLVFDPTENQVAPGGTVTTTFTIEVDDGDTAPTDSTTTVVATSINDAPVIGGTAAGQPVNDNATVSPFSAVTISDVDFGESVTVVVTLSDGDDNGAFTAASLTASGFTKTGVGEYSLAAGTPGAAQTAIRQLVFDPTENQVAPGGTVNTTFTIEVDDGDATPTDNTTTVVATSINDAPQIGGTAAGQPVDDNATVSPFSAVTISDVDFGESVTVVVTLSDGDDNGAFTAASLTASGFTKTGVGEYSLAAGTPAAAQTAIRQLVFDPTENQVAPGGTVTTTFTIEVDDGDTAPTDNSTTVVATSINDAPQIGGTAAGQPVDDNATVSPFSAVTISDVDFGESVTVVVTLSGGDANGGFTAASLTASGFTKTGVGEYSLAAGTPGAAQTAIRQLVFDPTENQVAPGGTVTTTFTIEVDDGDATPTDNTTTVVATSINDAPQIGGTAAGQPVDDNATVSPFSAVTISDVDFGESVTVVVTLSDGDDNGAFTAASLTTSGFTKTGVGEYSLAAGTPAAAQTAIRQLVFDPTENQVAPGGTVTTTFTIEVDDGDTAPTDNSTTVVATSVNDAPVIGGTAAGQPVNDNATVSPFSAVTISDVDFGEMVTVVVTLSDGDDNGAFTAASLTASGFTKTGVGEYSLAAGTPGAAQTAIRQLVFDPTENQVAPAGTVTTTFTIEVDDGDTAPTDNTTTVVATSINDAPVIGGTAAGQPVNDNATVSPFSAVTISDVDFGEMVTVVVTLSDGDDNGAFTAASLTASGFTKTGVGEYTLAAGTPGAAQTAIRQLVFDPTENQVAPGGTVNTTFTIEVDDGDTAPTDNTTTVVATSINSPPTATGFTVSLAENTANGTVVGSVGASDPDPGDSLFYTIVAGNTGGAFAIDASGQITVADSTALDFETTPVFSLTVEVNDVGGLVGSDSVTVTLTDEDEIPPGIDPDGEIEEPDPEPEPTETSPPDDPEPEPEASSEAPPTTLSLAGLDPSLIGGEESEEATRLPVLPGSRTPEPDDPMLEAAATRTGSDPFGPGFGQPGSLQGGLDFAARQQLSETLDRVSERMREAAEREAKETETFVATAQRVGLAASAGVIGLLLRGGSLVAAMLSSLPLWNRVDPLAVLGLSDEEREKWEKDLRSAQDDEEDDGVGRVLDEAETPPPAEDEDAARKPGPHS